jgi:cytochrome c oxidase subunit 2
MSMFYIGWKSYVGLREVPEDAMQVEVIGQMYSWLFLYDNDKETENELVVPKGKAVKLNITSTDVIHSFYIPAYRLKVDAVKGLDTYAWFMADEVGEYDILCSEFCGTGHSEMIAVLKIVPEDEYQKWLEEK